MSDVWMITQKVDLARSPVNYNTQPDALMLPGDNQAHTWRVEIQKNGIPANIDGATITGYFLRSDGNTVMVVGTAEGNIASVTLAQECYAFSGGLRAVMRCTKDGAIMTLAERAFVVRPAIDDGGTIDPGEVIPSIDELIAKIEEMEQATAAAEAAALKAVRYDSAQTLTAEQRQQARDNIKTVSKEQSIEDAGKVLVVGQDGLVTTGNADISEAVKVSLLNLVQHVAYIDDQGQSYYDALYATLYPDTIERISAVFNQNGYMFSPTDELDDLIPFLTVSVQYKNGTEKQVADYLLSGSLDTATSVITVTYLGKTTMFTVTVKQLPSGYTRKTYIQSDGSQYISTNITEVEAGGYSYKFKTMPFDSTPTARYLGHIFSSFNYYAIVLRHNAASIEAEQTNRYIASKRWGNESNSDGIYNSWTPNVIQTIKAYLNGDDNGYVDDSLAWRCSIGTTKDSSNKMLLLGYGGAPEREDFRYAGRLYFMKMYELGTNTKTHDYIPCVNSHSVAGVLDMVTNQFLTPTVGTFETD